MHHSENVFIRIKDLTHTYILIFDQIYLTLWLTKKTIIEFNRTTIDTEEEKEKSSAKSFIYYTVASRFVYIPRIKSNRTNQTYLRRSHIQYNQITTRGIFGSKHIGQSRSEKKHVWPAQSQNNSWKQ